MKVEPYLSFNGRCEEALEFYKRAVGAEVVMMMRFSESPEPCPPGSMPPGTENKIMHASMQIGSTVVMATDGGCQDAAGFEGISLALSVSDTAAADRAFNALADGGKVEMPLTKAFFSPSFGILKDKFGVTWMVVTEQ
jgi:PhnB protein